MKKMKHDRQRNIGKVVTGLLIGSILGATVGWLTAPLARQEMGMGRKLTGGGNGNRRSLQEKLKTSEGNVESRVRDLAAEMNENAGEAHPRKATS